MTIKTFAIAAVATLAMGLAFSAVAADGPGVGRGKTGGGVISDLGPLNIVDNFGDTYVLTAAGGSISGSSVACGGSGSYSVNGTYVGSTVHLNNILVSGGSCQNFVVDCVVNKPTKTCAGSFTNADGSGGPITLSKQ